MGKTGAPSERTTGSPSIETRIPVSEESCESVHVSCATISAASRSLGMATPPVSRMSATPASDTVTDSSTSTPGGMKLCSTCPRSPRAGPWINRVTSAVASWSPRGRKTGSGTMICALGSR